MSTVPFCGAKKKNNTSPVKSCEKYCEVHVTMYASLDFKLQTSLKVVLTISKEHVGFVIVNCVCVCLWSGCAQCFMSCCSCKVWTCAAFHQQYRLVTVCSLYIKTPVIRATQLLWDFGNLYQTCFV